MITTNLVEDAAELIDTLATPELALSLQISALGNVRIVIVDDNDEYKISEHISFQNLFEELCVRAGISLVAEQP